MIDLFIFNHPELTAEAADLGLDAVIVDLERQDKARRQGGVDTDISTDTIADLKRARSRTELPIICRVDAISGHSADQIDQVIDSGADEILIPMVRLASELEWALDHVDGRVPVGILVETAEAVANSDTLGALPLSRAYVGLNDLWIARRSPHRFSAFADGTVDRLADAFAHLRFGVAGLTHPDLGFPLPCRDLINELARLSCDFTFLRRSFFAAVEQAPARGIVDAIRVAFSHATNRSAVEVDGNRREAWGAIEGLAPERLDMSA